MQADVQYLKNLLSSVTPILFSLKNKGAISYLVGGCVRDLVLGIKIKDIDIEVHGISLEVVQEVLSSFGEVSLIGKQFGVLRLHGNDIDWSLPRRDSQGRKPTVSIDPTLTFPQAALRRDISMNAMGINLNDLIDPVATAYTIIDPYGGLEAIKRKELAAVDVNLFIEDPLRFFRVMQFIGRFEMKPNDDLNTLCRTMRLSDTYTNQPIARERIEEEIKKLLLKSKRPSLGFRWLASINRLEEIFPELFALIGVPQNPVYHPEGDVFEHAMQALDACAQMSFDSDDEKICMTLAALCHDLGKPATTDDQLRCYGHDAAGVPIAKKLLSRFTHDQALITTVSKLVHFHMRPLGLVAGKAKPAAYKRLAMQLSPEVSMHQLGLLALADWRGTNPQGSDPLPNTFPEIDEFMQKATFANVIHKPELPVLQGRDLIEEVKPGPLMGEKLKLAYEIQIEEGITNKEALKKRVLS